MPTVTQKDIAAGAVALCSVVAGGQPFFIGRNGTIETEVLTFFLRFRIPNTPYYREYPERYLDQIQRNAGVFPATPESIDAWATEYLSHLPKLTGLAAGWYAPMVAFEKYILDTFAPQAFRTPLRSLEPYYVPPQLQWTRQLSGKKVAIVSSFAETIQRQVWGENFPGIWTGENAGLLSPSRPVEWSFIRTGYAPITALGHAGWPAGVRCWQDAVEGCVREVVATGAHVAIIGCGGLGMIIAGRLRTRGISAFVLGGATQILFGVKGGRWERHEIISTFWNDAWVWPADDEIPGGAGLVEGGCYWGKDTGRPHKAGDPTFK